MSTERAPDRPYWAYRATLYGLLALAGLILTWSMNLQAFAQGRDFFGDWMNSGPAVSSLTFDLLVAATACTIFMIAESLRIGKPWLAACVLLSILAIAFAFPLFLALREWSLRPAPGR